MCHKIITLKGCGLYKCEYQFIGAKIQDVEVKQFDSRNKET